MICKVCFFNNKADWNNVLEYLTNYVDKYSIITSDESLNFFLKQHNIKSETFDKIFPFGKKLFLQLRNEARDLLNKYREKFNKIKFREFEIFLTLEPQLLNDLLLYLQSKYILEQNKDVLFIFKGFSFLLFTIKQLSIELDFKDDSLTIDKITNGKIKQITPSYKIGKSVIQKIHYLNLFSHNENKATDKKTVIQSSSSNFLDNNSIDSLNADEKHQNDRKSLLSELILFKIRNSVLTQSIDSILKKVDTKIQNTNSKNSAICSFFVTPSSDYMITPLFPIFETFNKNLIPFHIFVFDLQTSSILQKYNQLHTSFFEEAYMVSEILKKNSEGKQFIQFFKKIVKESDFLKFFYVPNSFNPVIDSIFFPLAIMIICEYIFKKMKLNSIVTAYDSTRIGNSAILAAKKFSIPSFTILTVIVPAVPMRSIFSAEYFCVYGTQGLDTLTSLGYDQKKIFLTGNPKYDYMQNMSSIEQKKKLCNEFGLDFKKKLIVVGLDRWNINDEKWMPDLIKFCDKKNFEIVIKVHPIYKTENTDLHELKVKAISKSCQNLNYLINLDMDSSMLIAAADIVISGHSNFGIEALLWGKSLITVNFSETSFDEYKKFYEYSTSIYLDDYNLLEGVIMEILEGKHLENLKEERKKLIEKLNIFNDSKASERIFKLLSNPLGKV